MKLCIAEGDENNVMLGKDIIGVKQISEEDIVIVEDVYNECHLGLLTMATNGQWFVTDVFKGFNTWPNTLSTTISDTLNCFKGNSYRIWKFTSKEEFIAWLANKYL